MELTNIIKKIDWSLWDGEFMQARCELGEWVLIDSRHDGITCLPADFFSPKEFPNFEILRKKGFGVCLSANGYMDCTEWAVFDTEQEAFDYLVEYYPPENDAD